MLIYEGPNHSKTGNIAVIATGIDKPSANRKTGDMIQIWILPADESPSDAIKSGGDLVVCGTCPLRPWNGGGCYVNVGQAPSSIWNKYKRGGYEKWVPDPYVYANKPVRIGAYGDVAEIPSEILSDIMGWTKLRGHTCYTHMWRTREDLKYIAMASVETWSDFMEAGRRGWSTFRVTDPNNPEDAEVGSFMCSATKGKVTCAQCNLCNGAEQRQRAIYIPAHGATAKRVHETRQE